MSISFGTCVQKGYLRYFLLFFFFYEVIIMVNKSIEKFCFIYKRQNLFLIVTIILILQIESGEFQNGIHLNDLFPNNLKQLVKNKN